MEDKDRNIVIGVGAIVVVLISVLAASGIVVELPGMSPVLTAVMITAVGLGILVCLYYFLTEKSSEEIEEEELRTELLELGVSDRKLQEIRKTYQQIALGALRTQRAAKYQKRIRVKTEKTIEAERAGREEVAIEAAIREAVAIQEEITEAEKRRDCLRDEARRINQEADTVRSERDEAVVRKDELQVETGRLQAEITDLQKAKAELETEKSELEENPT